MIIVSWGVTGFISIIDNPSQSVYVLRASDVTTAIGCFFTMVLTACIAQRYVQLHIRAYVYNKIATTKWGKFV
jgi:hypothetical protein